MNEPSEKIVLEPSEQVILHASNQDLRQRVVAILVKQDGATTQSPQTDPTPDVIEHRWVWAARWDTLETVTDGQIRDAVKDLWPLPEPPVEPPVE